jgi:hypothetical protein
MSWWKQHNKADDMVNESLDALHERFAHAKDIQVVRELAAGHDTPEEEALDHVCNSAELVADFVTVLKEIEAGVTSERAAELAASMLRQAS